MQVVSKRHSNIGLPHLAHFFFACVAQALTVAKVRLAFSLLGRRLDGVGLWPDEVGAGNCIQTRKSYNKKNKLGFTLIEMMLSIGVIAIITGISVPIYQSFQTRTDLDVAATTVAHSLRRAQLLSQASDGDMSWGVAIQTGSISLFKGISYSARDASFDEVFDLPGSLTPSGVSEIVFAKFTGLPQTTGTITLTSNTNELRSITINQKGMVAY